jgi:3-mercaptopyruvate sulfurtransferase SseA
VALKLRQAGFARIRPLLGGLEAWIEAGLPIEEAEPPLAAVAEGPLGSR